MRERLQAWADYIGGIGLAFLATSGILFLLNQPGERSLVLLALGVISLALYVYVRPQQVRETLTSRGVRYGSNALVMSIAFIGLIALLNFLSGRYNGVYDLTANKSQSLSDLTIKVLQGLKEPVQATAFYVTLRNDPQTLQEVQDRLKEYARYSDKFTYRFVDPQTNPSVANEYKAGDGTIVLEHGKRRENVFSTDEQQLTNTIVRVSQDNQSVIYFTTGHGEHAADDSGANGYSNIKSYLEPSNFKFNTINLRTVTSTLPSDITALVIAGPKQKFDSDEVQRVKDYLDRNGRVLVLVDPQTEVGLDSVLKAWGLTLRNDIVIDLASSIPGRPLLLVVQSFKPHDTTQDLSSFFLFFPSSRSIVADSAPPAGRSSSALFASSPSSWGETNFDSIASQNPQYDPNVDAKGPLDLAYAAQGTGDQAPRLVVIGSSSFAANSAFQTVQGSANDIFVSGVIKWLAGQENLIAIPPKTTTSAPMILPSGSAIFVLISSTVMLPGVILVIGALVWWRRR